MRQASSHRLLAAAFLLGLAVTPALAEQQVPRQR